MISPSFLEKSFLVSIIIIIGMKNIYKPCFFKSNVFQYFAIFESRWLSANFECGDPDRPCFYDFINLRMDTIDPAWKMVWEIQFGSSCRRCLDPFYRNYSCTIFVSIHLFQIFDFVFRFVGRGDSDNSWYLFLFII